jgi:hypothetical protein
MQKHGQATYHAARYASGVENGGKPLRHVNDLIQGTLEYSVDKHGLYPKF